MVIFGALEKESRWMSVWRDARRLMSRRPFRSPLRKLLLPCLNSHNGESGEPVWKTSLTGEMVRHVGIGKKGLRWHTFVKAIHVELPDERRDVGVFEVGTAGMISDCAC